MEVIRSRKRNVVDSKDSDCAFRQRGNLPACGEISMAAEGNNQDRSKSPPMRKYREVVGNFNRPSIDKGLAGAQKVAMRDLIGVCDDSSGKNEQSNGGFEWAGWSELGWKWGGSRSNHACNSKKMVDANACANVILGSSGLYGQDRLWAKLAIDCHQKEKVKLTYFEPTVEQDSIITGCPPLSVALKLWSLVGLSYMASTMGKPLALDKITEETCHDKLGHIGFMRILIEVDASPKLSKMIRMRMPSEKFCEENPMAIMVDYQ
ncbi:hypothetical protein Patl1_18784 [Pistacia atlantica]|uniref:Uncharacterized protein n=1 Tax=Pistacia atlantica TaxID=434234 RepID=A0ACC1BZ89_9ROSI|nr:hypothetical protein Patl1_18784 [Pistacia atlantica]